MKKTIMLYAVEGIVAGVIIYFSVKLFLLYFFFLWMHLRYKDAELIRKNISVVRTSLELKLLLMMKKLNVSKQDCIDIKDQFSAKNPEAWEIFYKDAFDIGIQYGEDQRII